MDSTDQRKPGLTQEKIPKNSSPTQLPIVWRFTFLHSVPLRFEDEIEPGTDCFNRNILFSFKFEQLESSKFYRFIYRLTRLHLSANFKLRRVSQLSLEPDRVAFSLWKWCGKSLGGWHGDSFSEHGAPSALSTGFCRASGPSPLKEVLVLVSIGVAPVTPQQATGELGRGAGTLPTAPALHLQWDGQQLSTQFGQR
jgi:hypothetical protein